MPIHVEGKRIVIRRGINCLWIDPWGKDGARVRMTGEAQMDSNEWALSEPHEENNVTITEKEVDMTEPWYKGEEWSQFHQTGRCYEMVNGKLHVVVNEEGWLSFYNQKGELLTQEYWRNRDRYCRYAVPLKISARELRPIPGSSDFELFARFEAFDDEKIYGMGQHQVRGLDKKGLSLDLEHRNSQASIPFYVSSRGYGFFWNNPAVGTVTFAKNKTEWHARSTKKLDYYITAGDTPAEIEYNYSSVTGRTPMMPDYGMGFWQCKLRYRNQQEVLEVAREHKRRGLPMDVIVIDFFHWSMQGNYEFDPEDFPDPDAMVKELREMGIEPVVSIWPTVDERSRNYGYMSQHGMLIRTDRGNALYGSNWMGASTYYDATNPATQRFVWEQAKKNYYDKGIHIFWLDEAEPEYGMYEFDNHRYFAGPGLQVAGIYPKEYARGFYDGLSSEGETEIMSLVRCAWAGSQKFGALTWSGDIHSSYRSFREQIQAGLSMGMSGIPWWTCDIGGFIGGDPKDKDFRELIARWFAWGCFLPVFRLHGQRAPWLGEKVTIREGGQQKLSTGADNEVWSYGEEDYAIMKKYLFLREKLRPYIKSIMKKASETGEPVMRPLFFDFPGDKPSWDIDDEYMFGAELLVAPVTEAYVDTRKVYLPAGCRWTESATGKVFDGGQTVDAYAPLDIIPVFIREGSEVSVY